VTAPRDLTREQAHAIGMGWGEVRECKPEVVNDALLLGVVRNQMDRSAGELFEFSDERREVKETVRGTVGLVIRTYKPRARR
jgi:hypothetical protein